jgi:hypothetical protein
VKRIKQTEIRPDIKQVIEQLQGTIDLHKNQIVIHQQAISDLEFYIKMWLERPPPEPQRIMRINSPLTRDLIRNLIRSYGQPLQTVQIIDLLYKGQHHEERVKLIKTLSVILNQMEKEGEITIEKRKGVKGNFYKWKK